LDVDGVVVPAQARRLDATSTVPEKAVETTAENCATDNKNCVPAVVVSND